jgi:hypothetical protein
MIGSLVLSAAIFFGGWFAIGTGVGAFYALKAIGK